MAGFDSEIAGKAPVVLIIGGGPGGMAAGIWAARLGLRPHILEQGAELGGQLLAVKSPITDYPGFPHTDGPTLAAKLAAHVEAMAVPVTLGCAAGSVAVAGPSVRTAAGETLPADAVVIATGAARRRLGLAEEARLTGRGVYYSVSRDRHRVAGRDAVIVGGGDSAVEGAGLLAEICPQVHLVARGALRARPDFIRRARSSPRIRFHIGRRVTRLSGTPHLAGVVLDDGTELGCAGLFIRIGVRPQTDFLRGAGLPLDEQGFLTTDEHQRCRGAVYAIGDSCAATAAVMSVSVSAGQAMIACKHIQLRWLQG